MAAGGHFGCPQITFNRISGHFRSIRNFLFWIFWQNARRRPFWMGGQCQLDQVGRPRPYMAPDIYQHSCQGSNLNSQNWSILWPWPAVMEGSRSKWSARCTSTLFPQLIGIIIREMGIIHKIEVFCDLDLQSWRGSRSKWSARCTSTLLPQLIGIIIGGIGPVV